MPTLQRIGFACLFILALAGCSMRATPTAAPTTPPTAFPSSTLQATGQISNQNQPAVLWPGEAWPTASAQDQGMDPGLLDALVKIAPQRAPNLSSVMIVRSGAVVLDEYFGSRGPGDTLEIYSVTKSFIATLIGIAIDQGWIPGVEAKVLSFFPEMEVKNPDPSKDNLTLENVLTMSTGLKWSEDDINTLYPSPDWTQFMLDLPMTEPPGSRFNYCSGCSHLLSAILQKTTGMDALAFARQYLFEPIGIRDATWLGDSQGLPIGGWGLQITPHDMARLGYLYLHQGEWDGRQIVSAAWINKATSAHIEVGDNPKLQYGYQWWIRPSMHGYAALGRNGQMIAVIPEKDLVVVFTASGADHEVEFRLIEEYVLPAAK